MDARREVGFQVRFERRFSEDTRLLVATEGVLTRRLQSDPLLSGFRTIVLDEFHERSLHADLALALAREAWRARPELRLARDVGDARRGAGVALSRTAVPSLEVAHARTRSRCATSPGRPLADAVRAVLARPRRPPALLPSRRGGDPSRAVASSAACPGARVLPLHGTLGARRAGRGPRAVRRAQGDPGHERGRDVADRRRRDRRDRHRPAQGAALRPRARARPARARADSRGLRRAARRPRRTHRAGPACCGCGTSATGCGPSREPEIERVDLAPPVLEVLAWGADPRAFEWFERPPSERARGGDGAARAAGGERRRPPHARRRGDAAASRAPAPRPRAAVGGRRRARRRGVRRARRGLAARPTRRRCRRPTRTCCRPPTAIREAPSGVRAAARELAGDRGAAGWTVPRAGADADERLLRALLAGFPDRVARRREPGSPRLALSSGAGARLGRESGVREGELLVALEITGGVAGAAGEPLVRVASRVETRVARRRDGARPSTASTKRRARCVRCSATPTTSWSWRSGRCPPTPSRPSGLLAEALERRGLGEAGERLRRRLRFAGLDADLHAVVRAACRGRTSLPCSRRRPSSGSTPRCAPGSSVSHPSGSRCRAGEPRRSTIARTAASSPP